MLLVKMRDFEQWLIELCYFCEQGCCLRAGESLQTKSCNIEESVNELMSIMLVDPEGTEGK